MEKSTHKNLLRPRLIPPPPRATLLEARIAAHIVLLTATRLPRSPLHRIFVNVAGHERLLSFAQSYHVFSPVRLSSASPPHPSLQAPAPVSYPPELQSSYNSRRYFSWIFRLSLCASLFLMFAPFLVLTHLAVDSHFFALAVGVKMWLFLPASGPGGASQLHTGALLQLGGPATIAQIVEKETADSFRDWMKEGFGR